MTQTETPAAGAAETPAAAVPANTRPYYVYKPVELELGSAVDQKAATEQLLELARNGKLVILARVGRTISDSAQNAVESIAQLTDADGNYVIDLKGDYTVIAESVMKTIPVAATETKRQITFG